MTTWLPIASAPKDGTRILVYIDGERGIRGIFMVEWDAGDDIEPDDDSAFYPAWFVCESGEEWFDAPTHWMPLPDPPPPGASAP